MESAQGGDTGGGARESAAPAALFHSQVHLLYASLPPGLLVTFANAGLLAAMEWHAVPAARLVAWLGAVLMVALARYRLTAYYHAHPKAHEPRVWGRYYAAATLAAGSVWGAAAIWLFPRAVLPQVFVFFMLTAMTATALISLAAVVPVALAFVIPVLAPLALRLFFAGGRWHEAMGVVAVVFMVVMLLAARRIGRTIATSLKLRFENRALVARLQDEKAAIEALNEDLRCEIAARGRAVLELKEREAYIRAVLEHVEEGIVTIDHNGCLRSLNRDALRIFGYEEDELLGSHFTQLVPAAERPEYARLLASCVEQEAKRLAGYGLEVNGLKRDGTVFPMELGLSVMTVGAHHGFVAVTRDVSARKRAERFKSDLVATLGHEIKTPLQSALGALGLLTETGTAALTGDDARLLRIARSNVERLARIVADLLGGDGGASVPAPSALAPLTLVGLAEDTLLSEAEYARGRHVRLALDPCSSALVVYGDRALLLRALSHLVSHAVDLAPAHTTIEIAVTAEAGFGVIAIRDCGTALSAEARAQLFDAAGAPGGLRAARAIAERHGGTVGCEAREAGGSLFFLRLPARIPKGDERV
ncbi:PAS domain S-box protein [Acidiferrobacter sp.]|uniref:PAS domain S-box protein n=1 Tax=Acidiferrobacter sp. TaxID=1872107 RepID=UPI002609E863|nr:PAS domain S-box protein [Acidiferrobacter sp.]